MSTLEHVPAMTFHGRKGVVSNAFRYSIDYVILDPENTPRGPALFSRNRRNLTALRDKDHGGAPGEGRGVAWVRDVLTERKLEMAGHKILLLAQPRVMGHVFNPVSFWLCYCAEGKLRVVISEVTNTYGDRHSYLNYHPDLREITSQEALHAEKIFYVSPFQPVKGDYTFRFDITDSRIGVWIDYKAGNGRLLATLAGPRQELTNRAILRACLHRPFGSRRVWGLIHWQALKLHLKGAHFLKRPEPPKQEIS